jgi:hypothetical protein
MKDSEATSNAIPEVNRTKTSLAILVESFGLEADGRELHICTTEARETARERERAMTQTVDWQRRVDLRAR